MRAKIIAVFAVVVLVVGGLSYALTRATLGDLASPGEAPRALAAASAQLQLDGLVIERWLAARATDPKLREPFNAGTAPARAEAATEVANSIRQAAASAPELSSIPLSLVVLVDKTGKVLGRNDSVLMRGDDLGSVYPSIRDALARNTTGSDVWVSRARNEQMLASFAPVHDASGQLIGGVAIGTALNDGRLTTASERTSGLVLLAAVKTNNELDVVAKSKDATPELLTAVAAAPARDGAYQALGSSKVVDLGGIPREFVASSQALAGYGDGHRLVLISAAKLQAPAILGALIWPALGVMALGLVLVAVGAHFLDLYISKPISELEDGLLAIMNGRTDLRFEIEHAELGGLVFRLNSLLNQLFNVSEDETDAEGRPSRAPAATSFEGALAVDERMAAAGAGDVADQDKLRAEGAHEYYDRIFSEYIAAKTSLGDPIDHITRQAFLERIMASERETAEKHGRPVRYKVEVRGREVVLLAVPLA